jgi:hypothetical protein
MKSHEGRVFITDSSYNLPLLDADGNIQMICAHGVDEITTVTRTRLPPIARKISCLHAVDGDWRGTCEITRWTGQLAVVTHSH